MHKPLLKTALGVLMATGLMGSYLYASHHTAGEFSASDAVTIARSGSFELDMTPAEALPLFTAPGERLWISSWDPTILNGDGFEQGTVFVTSGHGTKTYWLVADYDTQTNHARYVRTTPDVDTGTVDVAVSATEDGRSTVTVSYQVTGLSHAGNEALQASFSASQYAQMMEEWQTMIENNRDRIDEHFSR